MEIETEIGVSAQQQVDIQVQLLGAREVLRLIEVSLRADEDEAGCTEVQAELDQLYDEWVTATGGHGNPY